METMEERKLDEKESLELISQMIQNSKKRLELGSGNMFLLWGYVTLCVAIAVFTMFWVTGNAVWLWLWWAIPVLGYPLSYWISKPKEKGVVTYVDKVVTKVWRLVGGLCVFIPLLGLNYGNNMTILPLILLVLSFGAAVTGAIIEEKSLYNTSGFGLASSLCMLFTPIIAADKILLQIGFFAAAAVAMLIIPGHMINSKAQKECRNNN